EFARRWCHPGVAPIFAATSRRPRVPPVGVEPTLGTLLGGRPLPLGYGGWDMIPRSVRTILAQPNGEEKASAQFRHPIPRLGPVNAKRYHYRLIYKDCTQRVIKC